MNLPVVRAIELFLVFFFGIRKKIRHLPDEQCILAANHNSALDTYVLASLLGSHHRKMTRVIAAKDTFASGLLGWFARWSLDVVLVDRHAVGHHALLEEPKRLLQEGWSLILYPEGTRGEPGKIESFKRGVGVLATEFPDVPFYPVFIRGVERCLARNEYLAVPFEIALEVGEAPLYGRDFLKEDPDPRRASKTFAGALEDEVRRLGWQPRTTPPVTRAP